MSTVRAYVVWRIPLQNKRQVLVGYSVYASSWEASASWTKEVQSSAVVWFSTWWSGGSRCFTRCVPSVELCRLERWDHVLDVDERVMPALLFEAFQCFVHQIAQVLPLLLAVVNTITRVD